MSRINALHLINSLGDSSISRIIMRLVSAPEMNEIQWHIGALSGRGLAREEFYRCGARVVDFSEEGRNGKPQTEKNLRDYVTANKIQIIHTHTPRTIFSAALALHPGHETIHLATKHLLNRPEDRKWGTLFTLLDRVSLYVPDWLIPVSQKMHDQIVGQFGIRANRVIRIHNAIPCEQFYVPDQRLACRSELGISADTILLGYIGRIQKVKRLDVLLDGFNQLSRVLHNLHLVLVGDGDERPQLQSYADSLGISDRVTWTGHRKDIPRVLAALDIYLQTSANEGFSLSILEAMAAGKPIIATDVGGNSEVMRHGINGLLIPAGSTQKLVEAIQYLIECPETRDQISRAGKEMVQNQFSIGSMVDGYRNLYRSVVSENNL